MNLFDVLDGNILNSLDGLTIRRIPSLDIDASTRIRHDRSSSSSSSSRERRATAPFPSEENNHTRQVEDLPIHSTTTQNEEQAYYIMAKKKKRFETDLSSRHRLDDVSDTFPTFRKDEVLVGRFLGNGSTAEVSQVNGFHIKNWNVEEESEKKKTKNNSESHQRQFMVKRCHRDSGDARYAIKSIRKEGIKDDEELRQSIADLILETRFLSHLTVNHPHPNVMKLRAVASGEERFSPTYFIIMDRLYDTLQTRLGKWIGKVKRLENPPSRIRSFLLRGSTPVTGGRRLHLKEELRRERFVLYNEQLKAILGLSSALAHLHKHGLIHRDIKSTNMGFDVRNNIILFDLALGREIPDTIHHDGNTIPSAWKFTRMVGTPRYMAPEVALGGKYNERCDVFSYGIIMWQIMGLEQIPYGSEKKTNHNIEFFIQHVWQGPTVRPSLEFKNPMIQKYFCPQLQDLVMKCWSHRWQHRPSMAVVEENLRKFELVLM